jgi:hypothetical protein
VRKGSLRKILKIMSSDDRARVFEANSRACHPRIAIGINEIDLATKEHVTEIRTPRDENQCADENDFRQEREPPPHAPLKSAIRIPQSEIFVECTRGWSPEVCYVLLSDRGGPVAQRLEQGTHNSRERFCAGFHRLGHCCQHRCFNHFGFAPCYAELRRFAAKSFPRRRKRP